jgi:hypothetical protein
MSLTIPIFGPTARSFFDAFVAAVQVVDAVEDGLAVGY